jgi:hypothetical protein
VRKLSQDNQSETGELKKTVRMGTWEGHRMVLGRGFHRQRMIVNPATKKVLNLSGGNYADGNNIHFRTRNGTPARIFRASTSLMPLVARHWLSNTSLTPTVPKLIPGKPTSDGTFASIICDDSVVDIDDPCYGDAVEYRVRLRIAIEYA